MSPLINTLASCHINKAIPAEIQGNPSKLAYLPGSYFDYPRSLLGAIILFEF